MKVTVYYNCTGYEWSSFIDSILDNIYVREIYRLSSTFFVKDKNGDVFLFKKGTQVKPMSVSPDCRVINWHELKKYKEAGAEPNCVLELIQSGDDVLYESYRALLPSKEYFTQKDYSAVDFLNETIDTERVELNHPVNAEKEYFECDQKGLRVLWEACDQIESWSQKFNAYARFGKLLIDICHSKRLVTSRDAEEAIRDIDNADVTSLKNAVFKVYTTVMHPSNKRFVDNKPMMAPVDWVQKIFSPAGYVEEPIKNGDCMKYVNEQNQFPCTVDALVCLYDDVCRIVNVNQRIKSFRALGRLLLKVFQVNEILTSSAWSSRINNEMSLDVMSLHDVIKSMLNALAYEKNRELVESNLITVEAEFIKQEILPE